MMQAGDYNEPFWVQKVTYSIDENGDQIPSYKTVYSGYAKVNNLSGKEYWDAMSVHSENTLKFYARWNDNLRDLDTKQHVLKWRDRYLDILTIDNVEHRNAECIIKAAEVDDHG